MLAVLGPQLNNGSAFSSDLLSCRGRSRQVSRTALARQASEERRTLSDHFTFGAVPFFPTGRSYIIPSSSKVTLDKVRTPSFTRPSSPSPASSASMSPTQIESPLPPLSLEDQVHQAYALEDIHLAKILLLRLKGIEVISDDDPRIAAVQDEDFDFCFLPNGPLLSEQDEQSLKQIQTRELERVEESKRVERMRMCERKWIEEKQRLRAQRVAEYRRRERKRQEEEQRLQRAKEEERRRLAEDEHRKSSRASLILRAKARTDRKFVNYDHLASKHPSSTRDRQFVYDYMIASPLLPVSRQTPTSPPTFQTRPRFPTPSFDESRAIPFRDVLRSMEGRLFPLTDEEQVQHRNLTPSNSRSRTVSRQRGLQLLGALLAEPQYTEEKHRNRQGKVQERGYPQRYTVCLACSGCRSFLSSPSSTPSSSAVSRTSSWLSFKTSSSLSSSYTDITTPSSSPVTSRKSSWLGTKPQLLASTSSSSESHLRHSCRAYNHLYSVPLSESPLLTDVPKHSPVLLPLSFEGRQRCSSRASRTKEGTSLLAKKLFELAKNIHNTYLTTLLFGVAMSHEERDDHPFFAPRKKLGNDDSDRSRALGAPGSRASIIDVKHFLDLPAAFVRCEASDLECLLAPKYIPLMSPTKSPRTNLPDPLPYRLHFKPIPNPVRPFHHHTSAEIHTVYPLQNATDPCQDSSEQVSWRIRCVGNPEYLRLKAVQNIVWRKGVKWEGCGRETAMGGGRERVIGVAYEGVGRSNMSYSFLSSA